jgi:hypothetical protein
MHLTHPRGLALALLVFSMSMGILPPATVQAGVPGSTSALNVDEHGVALRGYDPVAYFSSGKPTPGIETISASYGGARYLFATKAHKKRFVKNPQKYIPQFGGFCSVGTANGQKVDTDPMTGEVVNGKLYLNYNAKVSELFKQDTPGIIGRAERNWPAVKDQTL